jgi:hypothetical protein
MDKQKAIIGALAMDLKRVALSLYRKSYGTADRFKEEALKRSQELEKLETEHYIRQLILKMKSSFAENTDKAAEDALMYSTLFQNYAVKKLSA